MRRHPGSLFSHGQVHTMIIYTDGSCHGNPGRGGWALYCPETGLENWGSAERTTNNRMELTAIIHAMQVPGVTKIMTDSEYCCKGANMWYKGWVKKDWKTSSGSKVKNDDLWRRIVELDPERVQFEWVKAHATNEHNNHVDQLANNAAETKETEADVAARLNRELEQIEKRRDEIREHLMKIGKLKM